MESLNKKAELIKKEENRGSDMVGYIQFPFASDAGLVEIEKQASDRYKLFLDGVFVAWVSAIYGLNGVSIQMYPDWQVARCITEAEKEAILSAINIQSLQLPAPAKITSICLAGWMDSYETPFWDYVKDQLVDFMLIPNRMDEYTLSQYKKQVEDSLTQDEKEEIIQQNREIAGQDAALWFQHSL